ncbi:S-protein homolog 21 [Linum perenne]
MFIVAVATILLATVPSSSASFFKKSIHAHIVNQLSPNNVLYVHCKCTDHDIGEHYVNVGSEFEWRFKEHAFFYTNWNCYLAPDYHRHVYYSAYYDQIAGKYLDKENNIYWLVRDDGIYLRNFEKNTDDGMYPWEKN